MLQVSALKPSAAWRLISETTVCNPLFATVGLGVSNFGYCIFELFVSVVLYIDPEHGFGVRIRCTGMAIEREARNSVPGRVHKYYCLHCNSPPPVDVYI